MSVTSLSPSASWEVCAIINGHLVRRVYIGFTRAESVERFKSEHGGDES